MAGSLLCGEKLACKKKSLQMFKLQGGEGHVDEALMLLAVVGNKQLCCPLVAKQRVSRFGKRALNRLCGSRLGLCDC